MSRPTLAAVLIVKNEADNLAECLATLDWVDEIVVMDSGSTDATRAVAEAAGARFFVNDQWPGFGPQRRLAQMQRPSRGAHRAEASHFEEGLKARDIHVCLR